MIKGLKKLKKMIASKIKIEDYTITDNQRTENIEIRYYDQENTFFDIKMPLEIVKIWSKKFHPFLFEECYQVDHSEVELDYQAEKFFSYDTFEAACDNEDLKGIVKHAMKHYQDDITIKTVD